MSNISRNDPCPCGSGKKYKKCCLAKDEEVRQANVQKEIQKEENNHKNKLEKIEEARPQLSVTKEKKYKSEESELAEKERKAFWDKFKATDYEGKIAIFMEKLNASEGMSDDLAFDLLEGIHQEAIQRKDWKKLRELGEVLRNNLPEIYQKSKQYYLQWQIEDMMSDQQWNLLEPLVLEMPEIASTHIDQFCDMQDWLEYYGRLPLLVKAMRIAWPEVDKSKHIVPWAIDDFKEKAIIYEIFVYLESIPSLSHINETDLLEKLKYYDEIRADWLSTYLSYLTERHQRKWTLEDFPSSSFKKRARKDQYLDDDEDLDDEEEEETQDGRKNLYHLSLGFLGYLYREKSVSYPKAEAARDCVQEYILERGAGELEYRESLLSSIQREIAGKPKPKHRRSKIENILCPDRETLDRYLTRFFDFLGSRPHTRPSSF